MSYNKETGMYEGYIYKIVNDINDKVYIGQTRKTISTRWNQHIYDSKKSDNILYKAFRKYGSDKFHIIKIEKIRSSSKDELISKLNKREIFWIKNYNSYKDGYNMTIGGDTGLFEKEKKKIIEYSMNGCFIRFYDSISDAEESNNYNNISACCNKKVPYIVNKIYRFIDDPLTETEIEWYKRTYPTIYQYDYLGNLINTYDFIYESKEWLEEHSLNFNSANITACCAGKVPSANGFVWRKYPDKFDTYNIPKRHLKKIIEQRDIFTGRLIATYNSFPEIKEKLNLPSYSRIVDCCNKKAKTAYGFCWNYFGYFNPNDIINNGVNIYEQYSNDGKLLNIFYSKKEIEENLCRKISLNNINSVCYGHNKTAYGYIWKMKEKIIIN